MKNYKNSSYAANKYSKDIVYNSEVSGSTSITLDDFLKSDPTLTKADFEFWKNWSDEDYRVESKETNNQTKKDVLFTSLDEVVAGFELSIELFLVLFDCFTTSARIISCLLVAYSLIVATQS